MDDEAARLFRLATRQCEDAANGVIDEYFEKHNLDGGDELIALVCRAVNAQYEAFQQGEFDRLLATWRHRSIIH